MPAEPDELPGLVATLGRRRFAAFLDDEDPPVRRQRAEYTVA